MSQRFLYNPSALANLHLTFKTPCPRCPMSQSKQTQFHRGRLIVPTASAERSAARFNSSAKCRTCPESRKPYSRQMKISCPRCPMSQTNQTAFKFQINQTIFKPKEKAHVAHVPAVPCPKPTNRKYISEMRKIKYMSPMSPNVSTNQPTNLYIQRLFIKWRRNKLPSSIPERIHIVATTV